MAWFSWTNHNPLLRIATNGIASFCIDHRWRQMDFFVFVKMGKAPLSRALREIKQLLCVQSLILYYIKQIVSMLPCICPVIDHRGRQNVVRTSVTHSAIASCATFLFLPHFDVICDLLLDRCTATWNLFVKHKNKFHFSKYSALFPKVQRFINQVRFQSDLSGRTRSTSLCLLDTFLSKTVSGNFDYLSGLVLIRS